MTALTLATANAIIEAAFAKAAELKLKPLGVSVLDAGGHLVAFQRQDGASLLRPQMSAGKAFGALAIGMGSRRLETFAKGAAASGVGYFRRGRARHRSGCRRRLDPRRDRRRPGRRRRIGRHVGQ